jgi:DNA-binding NarL/FixJ family response regulator
MKRDVFQLAVIDISLARSIAPEHNRDGFQLLTSMQQANVPAIVVSGSADTALIDQAYQENKVVVFLEKQAFERKALLETITQIQSQSFDLHSLTEREIEVLSLVARGMSNKEISVELYITVNTVKRHLKSIFEKLEVNSRTAASAFAIRMGLGGQAEEP